ncbi:metal ABC transporter substrate-binding protein [Fructobacillus sp. M2-14]|uniref:Metal ABC transporter substrate-binding protein n=1 Tax=Fructobacillus broussonetiae TaxID=2713173 RepID=A0ABS5QY66_9LACO|nr:MetQ/NlpA family ABC transporter substrate-binding protein [Fructobacillus broussonetiae]MBS9338140.1 metal ABC transporter substrate-binding protein [Fructobacillus broussonetiae]
MTKKKMIWLLAAIAVLALGYLSFGPKHKANESKVITVATAPGPYSELFMDGIKPILEKEGYTVKNKSFNNLLNADIALDNNEADVNVDQHSAYLKNFNKEKKGNLTALTKIPTVPMSLYQGNKKSLADLSDGDTIAIPDDASNKARAYRILAQSGLITLKKGVNEVTVTQKDIESNPNNLQFKEIDSSTIPRVRDEFAYVVLPGSVAYAAKVPAKEILVKENVMDDYYLVLTVNKSKQNTKWAKAVKKAYQSEEFKKYFEKKNSDHAWVTVDN